LGYRLVDEPVHGCARVEWLGVVEQDADRVLAPRESEDERDALRDASEFLTDLLASGPVAATDVERQRRAAGIAPRTLARAKKAMGVASRRVGGIADQGSWQWSLPPNPAAVAYVPKEQTLSNLVLPGIVSATDGETGAAA
jgi:hypothetical protein